MPKQTPHIIELLRRWLRGDARARDEHRLEQSAAGDDFLRDALEGYRRFPESDHEAADARLRGRLRQRTGKASGGMVLPWLPRVAAAAVALLTITGLAWLFLQNDATGDRMIARKEEAPMIEAMEAADSPLADNVVIRERESAEAATELEKEKSVPSLPEPEAPSEPAPREPSSEALADNSPPPDHVEESAGAESPPPDVPAAYDYSFTTTEEDTAPGVEITAAPQQAPLSALRTTRGLTARSIPPDTSSRFLQGRILTPEGEPIIGASILLPGATRGTVTDLDGNFSIQAPADQETFTISYAGYQSASIPIDRQDTFRITLEDTAPLSEVVITDISQAKSVDRSIAKISDASQTAPKMRIASPGAVPRKGFPNLEKYIRDNLQYPDAARRKGVEGIVLLQFTVQADGSLHNFEVLQSLNPACDEEAVRLLKKGPKWEVQNRKAPVTTTYPVRFELE